MSTLKYRLQSLQNLVKALKWLKIYYESLALKKLSRLSELQCHEFAVINKSWIIYNRLISAKLV